MKKDIERITLCNTDLDVEFTYTKGCDGNYLNAPEPDEVEIWNVFLNGVDIKDLLSNWALDYIEEQIKNY